MTTDTMQRLEEQAAAAHHQGETWLGWWCRHRMAVAEATQGHEELRAVHDRLMQIVVTGEASGQYAAGDDDAHLLDAEPEAVPVNDVTTQARWQGSLI